MEDQGLVENFGPTVVWYILTHQGSVLFLIIFAIIRDSHKCFKRLAPWGDVVRLYFVGDSRLKKLFNAFVYHINDEIVEENTTSEASISNNFQYVAGEVDLVSDLQQAFSHALFASLI